MFRYAKYPSTDADHGWGRDDSHRARLCSNIYASRRHNNYRIPNCDGYNQRGHHGCAADDSHLGCD